jgi:hypothetical protein
MFATIEPIAPAKRLATNLAAGKLLLFLLQQPGHLLGVLDIGQLLHAVHTVHDTA